MVARDESSVNGAKRKRIHLFTNIVIDGYGRITHYEYDACRQALINIIAGPGRHRHFQTQDHPLRRPARTDDLNRSVRWASTLPWLSHAVRDDLRDELVPLNKKYPITGTAQRPAAPTRRRITRGTNLLFEYVMLKGVNDSDADAHELVAGYLPTFTPRVNFDSLAFNPWPGAP